MDINNRKALEKIALSLSSDYYKDIVSSPITREKIVKLVQDAPDEVLLEWILFVSQSPSSQIEVIKGEIQYGNSKPAKTEEEAMSNWFKDNLEVGI